MLDLAVAGRVPAHSWTNGRARGFRAVGFRDVLSTFNIRNSALVLIDGSPFTSFFAARLPFSALISRHGFSPLFDMS